MVEEKKEYNPFWLLVPIFLLLLVSFAIAFSVVSPKQQPLVITEEMQERMDKDAQDIVVQLKNASPEQQKNIIESYSFKPEKQKKILENLKLLKEVQENLEKTKKNLEESNKSLEESEKSFKESENLLEKSVESLGLTEELSKESEELLEDAEKNLEKFNSNTNENLLLNFLYESGLADIKSLTLFLENDVKLRLLDITFETPRETILSYSELFTDTFIIAVTLISLFVLVFINTPFFDQFFAQLEKKDVKIVGENNFIVSRSINNYVNLQEKNKGEVIESESWHDALLYTHKRLWDEEENMKRINRTNLNRGIISVALGLFWLFFLIFLSDDVEDITSFPDFLANYWSRVGSVIIVGFITAFFLRLYTQTIRRIDKNRNEITNIELRLASGLMMCDTKDKTKLKFLAEALAKEERNFVLDKTESSTGINAEKILGIISKTSRIGG